jgi:hypothetical protein
VTGVTSGWPSDATLSYSWGYGCGESGDGIEGAITTSLAIPDDAIGCTIAFAVTGSEAGHSDTTKSGFMTSVVTAPKKTAVAAPATDTTALTAYLTAHDAAPAAASTAGLPTSLDTSKDYTANVTWTSADSYVDVYAYSTPTFVGTFPVVNGVAQINVSHATLAAIGGGSHTLVAIGQSSGGVQSVAISVSAALASTGFDPMLPIGIASIFLLLGASLMLMRRSQLARATA